MKKILSLILQGNPTIKILKIVVALGGLAIVYKVIMLAWLFLATNNPSIKRKIDGLSDTIALKNDSLRTAEINIVRISKEIYISDSIRYGLKDDLAIKESQVKQLQNMNLNYKKLVDKYREEGVYYIFIKRPILKDVFRESSKAEIDSLRK